MWYQILSLHLWLFDNSHCQCHQEVHMALLEEQRKEKIQQTDPVNWFCFNLFLFNNSTISLQSRNAIRFLLFVAQNIRNGSSQFYHQKLLLENEVKSYWDIFQIITCRYVIIFLGQLTAYNNPSNKTLKESITNLSTSNESYELWPDYCGHSKRKGQMSRVESHLTHSSSFLLGLQPSLRIEGYTYKWWSDRRYNQYHKWNVPRLLFGIQLFWCFLTPVS